MYLRDIVDLVSDNLNKVNMAIKQVKWNFGSLVYVEVMYITGPFPKPLNQHSINVPWVLTLSMHRR